MSTTTSEQLNEFICKQENHAYVREDFDIEGALEYLRDYATHLRERESAKAVARLVVRDGRAAGWEFNAPMPNGTYDLYTAPQFKKE